MRLLLNCGEYVRKSFIDLLFYEHWFHDRQSATGYPFHLFLNFLVLKRFASCLQGLSSKKSQRFTRNRHRHIPIHLLFYIRITNIYWGDHGQNPNLQIFSYFTYTGNGLKSDRGVGTRNRRKAIYCENTLRNPQLQILPIILFFYQCKVFST